MFANKIDTFQTPKDDKLKSHSNQNFDFEGEGFSSMLEKEEVSGVLRETDAEIMEDEAILSTDEENRAIAKRNNDKKAQKLKEQKENSVNENKADTDERRLLRLMDMNRDVNMAAIKMTRSKKELEQITGVSLDSPEELSQLVQRILNGTNLSNTPYKKDVSANNTNTETGGNKNSDREHSQNVLHETHEEILEDLSILSTDEENLAMANKAKEYKALNDDDFVKPEIDDIDIISEIKSINNQANIEVRTRESMVQNVENQLSQFIQKSNDTIERINLSELKEEDVDFIIKTLQEGSADFSEEDKNQYKLSAKFLDIIKEALINKKVFRIDFDNEISVIIKIDREGRISANFLTTDKDIEEGLKNNLYILRKKFEEQNIKYDRIEYTSSDIPQDINMQEILNTINEVKDTHITTLNNKGENQNV